MAEEKKKVSLKDFPPMYWLVIIFEFFERGSYYGMMSILSVYLTDQLNFTKESVGLIKSTIQPLLYFLPILAGAIADRMGYRRTLMVAFSLLGIWLLPDKSNHFIFCCIFLAGHYGIWRWNI
jgi:dipeptide/tripeptide permease